jgi:uncharacterized membrane protein
VQRDHGRFFEESQNARRRLEVSRGHHMTRVTPEPATNQRHRRSALDLFFHWGVVFKGLYGAGEILSGLFLGFVSPGILQHWATLLTQERLSHDPDDFLSNALSHFVDGLTTSAVTFAAIYLVVHGLVKVGLLWAVLTRRYRVYPWAIGILIAFIGYQTYELVVAFSAGLLVLTLFDAVIVLLTVREYRQHRHTGAVHERFAEEVREELVSDPSA